MVMNKQKIDIRQLDIFSIIKELSDKQAKATAGMEISGKASIDAAVRSIISDTLKRCPLSRYEVAARMSEILGVEITKAQIDAWSAESKENHRFPLVYTGAFCIATREKTLARYIAQLCGGYFIESEDALLLELGRVEDQKAELLKKEGLIRDLLASTKKGDK
jgi:hypothetical protein